MGNRIDDELLWTYQWTPTRAWSNNLVNFRTFCVLELALSDSQISISLIKVLGDHFASWAQEPTFNKVTVLTIWTCLNFCLIYRPPSVAPHHHQQLQLFHLFSRCLLLPTLFLPPRDTLVLSLNDWLLEIEFVENTPYQSPAPERSLVSRSCVTMNEEDESLISKKKTLDRDANHSRFDINYILPLHPSLHFYDDVIILLFWEMIAPEAIPIVLPQSLYVSGTHIVGNSVRLQIDLFGFSLLSKSSPSPYFRFVSDSEDVSVLGICVHAQFGNQMRFLSLCVLVRPQLKCICTTRQGYVSFLRSCPTLVSPRLHAFCHVFVCHSKTNEDVQHHRFSFYFLRWNWNFEGFQLTGFHRSLVLAYCNPEFQMSRVSIRLVFYSHPLH